MKIGAKLEFMELKIDIFSKIVDFGAKFYINLSNEGLVNGLKPPPGVS